MSRLDTLLQELCPDGIEYKKLKDVGTNFFRGSGIKRTDVVEEGIPCVRYGEIYTDYGICFDTCKSHTVLDLVQSPKYFGYGAILFAITGESIIDIAKCTAYVGQDRCLAGGDIVVMEHNENPKYLSYALSTTDAVRQKGEGKIKSKVVHSSVPAIMELEIPIPPLEVQREIVRILDKFMQLKAELTENLSVELSARRIQYEHYRDRLLTFGDAVEYKKIEDVCRTLSPSVKIKTNDYLENGLYPVIDQGQDFIGGYTNIIGFPEDEYVIFGDHTCVVKYVDFAFVQGADGVKVLASKKPIIIPKFLYYCMNSIQIDVSYARHWSKMKKKEVPVPPLPVQQEIVHILDNFSSICTDISSGLPAEIEARTKQYEYYRDQLLSFKRKEAS